MLCAVLKVSETKLLRQIKETTAFHQCACI